ncbi:MAG: peptidoglycan DD-metalloendopeptidase family protein [Bacteroidales bacterium]|nr:peptidoglycan DD-metalloendopeptidase family protein [Bacteroidales bacterium]
MNKRLLWYIIPLLIISILVFLYIFVIRKTDDITIEARADTLKTEILPINLLYDVPVDSFFIEKGRVKQNQNLVQILKQFNLPEGSINRLILNGQKAFDLRKIKAGNNFTAFLSQDTLYQLRYFVYEHTPVDYVFFDFTDSLKIDVRQKEVKSIRKKAAGIIESSLWNAMKDAGIHPMVAIELSEIYAWTIDFFGLQVGDSFRIIYNEILVDTMSVGIEKIEAAYFRHDNRDYYAIPFTQDSTESYFDTDGNSLRKAFLKAPLRFSRISSKFSHSRLHPILKIRRPHHGVDYAAPVGTPVVAIGDGKIIKLGYQGQAGKMVKIRHNSIYSTAYLHLSSYGKGVTNGAYVKQGDVIGYVGSTGLSTGPHLDFRFYKNNVPVDPLKVEAPSVDPVKEENMAAFDSVKSRIIRQLDSF